MWPRPKLLRPRAWFQISGYPTLILFRNGERVEYYNGAGELDSLYTFVMRRHEPELWHVTAIQQYNEKPVHYSWEKNPYKLNNFVRKNSQWLLKPWQNEDRLCGNIVSCDVARPWQNAATLLRAARTQEIFLKIFRNILCPGDKICIRHKCCARGKTSQHLGNMTSRQQCCRHNVSSFCRPQKLGDQEKCYIMWE